MNETRLNSHGVNSAIKAYILPENKMREIGNKNGEEKFD